MLFLTVCGKTAGFAFLKINLQQISFDYGLNLQSCSFLILLPRLKLQSEIQYDCATLSTFQLSNVSEDILKTNKQKKTTNED